MVHCLIYGRGIFDNSTMSSKLRVRYANKQNLDKYDLIFIPGQSDIVVWLAYIQRPQLFATQMQQLHE